MVKNYISLKEATKYCPYSQDYLKLRARHGKLKAIKIGKNWFTTQKWVKDYLNKFSTPRLVKRGRRRQRKEFQPSFRKKVPIISINFKKYLLFLLILIITFTLLGTFLKFQSLNSLLEKIIPAKEIEIKR